MSGEGTKVTTDPAGLDNPKNENPGVVTSDSLGAESINSGGSFAANSDARGPMDQPSRSTNTNTTDTSNATKLEPARDAEARQSGVESSKLNEGSGADGKGPTYNIAGSGIGAGGSAGGPTASSGNAAASSGGASSSASDGTGNLQPKGKNITEGGFDSDAPNASFTQDIGGKNDPGRVGLQQQDVPVSGGAGPRQDQVTNDGQFDALGDTEA